MLKEAIKLFLTKKASNLSIKGFQNNLSHAVPMDGVKSGPDENRTPWVYDSLKAVFALNFGKTHV